MRKLICAISPRHVAAAREVVARARSRENWIYESLPDKERARDHSLVIDLLPDFAGGIVCTYTVTVLGDLPICTLGVSRTQDCGMQHEGPCMVPPSLAELIAVELFGFSGRLLDWRIAQDKKLALMSQPLDLAAAIGGGFGVRGLS